MNDRPQRSVLLIIWILGSASAPVLMADPDIPPSSLDVDTAYARVQPESRVQVRENTLLGTTIRLKSLGLDDAHVISLGYAHFFDAQNAISLRLRTFLSSGQSTLQTPIDFNGATLAGQQSLRTTISPWYSLGLFYKRRLLDSPRRQIDGDIGLEYSSLNFQINRGRAAVAPGSTGSETKEDFYLQELPIPTMALRGRWPVARDTSLEATIKGSWINHANSLRKEGGTVWLSQSSFETHFRINWKPNATSLKLGVGIFYETFYQEEQSTEDGNFIRWSAMGPEIGANWSF